MYCGSDGVVPDKSSLPFYSGGSQWTVEIV